MVISLSAITSSLLITPEFIPYFPVIIAARVVVQAGVAHALSNIIPLAAN